MVVPGDVPSQGAKRLLTLHTIRLHSPNAAAVNLRLDSVQSCHVHLEQPILPVDSGDPVVVDASRYVTEPLPVFPEAVMVVVDAEGTRCTELQRNTNKRHRQEAT